MMRSKIGLVWLLAELGLSHNHKLMWPRLLKYQTVWCTLQSERQTQRPSPMSSIMLFVHQSYSRDPNCKSLDFLVMATNWYFNVTLSDFEWKEWFEKDTIHYDTIWTVMNWHCRYQPESGTCTDIMCICNIWTWFGEYIGLWIVHSNCTYITYIMVV